MFNQHWGKLKDQYNYLLKELLNPNLEVSKRNELQKEVSRLSAILSKHEEAESISRQLKEVKKQAESNTDESLSELYHDEINLLEERFNKSKKELEDLLFPPDKKDNKSVFLEIRAGAGGKEAALFAANLMKMYYQYAVEKGWKVSVLSASPTDLGGFREVVLYIKGKGAYGHLKHEAGVHRVQRIPETETSGRIHTSTSTVAVLPEVEDLEFNINPNDLRIDVYRASGAGGQHVNTTDSAVRITHIPTGIIVTCQDERSQYKNKAKALKMLRAKLLSFQEARRQEELGRKRKEMIGTGMRAEKVRTYNFPQNRVTDHQINLTLKKLDLIMEGHLDELIEALMAKDREMRRKKSFSIKNQPKEL